MPLAASGEMALGGATVGRSVNLELNRAATASIEMNETAARTLAAVASGQISISNFYGKSNAPTAFGQEFQGGYYTGLWCSYYLLIAPNATGCAICAWKTTNTSTTGTSSCSDGYANVHPAMENTTHPAGNWTATRSINGYSDWYLPARDELVRLSAQRALMPAGEGYPVERYWSSTQYSLNVFNACARFFCTAGFTSTGNLDLLKNRGYRSRAIRRVPV